DVCRVQRRGVVDAVAEKAHHVAGLLQGEDDALLLAGVDLGEQRHLGHAVQQFVIRHAQQLAAGDLLFGVQAHPSATWRVTRWLSPLITFTCTPNSASRFSVSATPGSGGSKISRKPSKSSARSSATVQPVAPGSARLATPSTR